MIAPPVPLTIKGIEDTLGCSLSDPSKMPGFAYGIPAHRCHVGSILRKRAGSVCAGCYALKGRYVFPGVLWAGERRYRAMEHPLWVPLVAELVARKSKGRGVDVFRWLDSGDLQSVDHLRAIVRVCELTPKIRHWLPTREKRILQEYLGGWGGFSLSSFPENLVVRYSMSMVGQEPTYRQSAAPWRTSTVGAPGGWDCPASTQGNECGSCRACWNPLVANINYAWKGKL
jgi:hypothetical protein